MAKENSGVEVVLDEGPSEPIEQNVEASKQSSFLEEEVEEKVDELTLEGQPGICQPTNILVSSSVLFMNSIHFSTNVHVNFLCHAY